MDELSTPRSTDELLTPGQVASKLKLRVRSIVGGALRHRLPWIHLGHDLRLRESDLERFLADNQQSVGPRTIVRPHHDR